MGQMGKTFEQRSWPCVGGVPTFDDYVQLQYNRKLAGNS